MIRPRTLFTAACVVAALGGCKREAEIDHGQIKTVDAGSAYLIDKDRSGGLAQAPAPSEARANEAPATTAERDEHAAKVPSGATAGNTGGTTEGGAPEASKGAQGGTTDSAQDRARESAAKEQQKFPTAQLSGPSAVSGVATFRDDDGRTRVVIEMRGAKPGTYVVQTLNQGDCAAIAKMETPFAGGPGVAGEGKSGSPGPAKTLALWQNVGVFQIDASGAGRAELTAANLDGARIGKQAIVIYPQAKPDAPPAKGSNVTACGVFGGAERASQG